MSKIINYCTFVIASLVMVVGFVTATTYTQLGVAILLYPLLAYFAFEIFPRKIRDVPPVAIQPLETAKPERDSVGIVDIDKRAFLKLIGAAGISLFLYSIFIKKGEAPFFRSASAQGTVSLQDSAGNKIDPAERTPTDGYKITEVDDSVITYFGFTNRDSAWFIMREDTDTGSFRYARGAGNFPSSWNNREHLGYDYFNNVFKS